MSKMFSLFCIFDNSMRYRTLLWREKKLCSIMSEWRSCSPDGHLLSIKMLLLWLQMMYGKIFFLHLFEIFVIFVTFRNILNHFPLFHLFSFICICSHLFACFSLIGGINNYKRSKTSVFTSFLNFYSGMY